LLADKQVVDLANNKFGQHVVRALLATPGMLKQETEQALRGVELELRHSRFGKALLKLLSA